MRRRLRSPARTVAPARRATARWPPRCPGSCGTRSAGTRSGPGGRSGRRGCGRDRRRTDRGRTLEVQTQGESVLLLQPGGVGDLDAVDVTLTLAAGGDHRLEADAQDAEDGAHA